MKTYVSGMDSKVYIGFESGHPRKLDIITLEYTESQNKLPIFGYKSFEWDQVLDGEEVVQGTFSLNARSALTLNNFLKSTSNYTRDLHGLPIQRSTQIGTSLYKDNEEGRSIYNNGSNLITKSKLDLVIKYNNVKYKYVKPGDSLYSTKRKEKDKAASIQSKAFYQPIVFQKGIKLKDIRINSIQQAIDANGSPIGEFYGFIGRSVLEYEEAPINKHRE